MERSWNNRREMPRYITEMTTDLPAFYDALL